MAFKKIMMYLKQVSDSNMSLSDLLQLDKDKGYGVEGGYHGYRYYIPADAKLGGL